MQNFLVFILNELECIFTGIIPLACSCVKQSEYEQNYPYGPDVQLV